MPHRAPTRPHAMVLVRQEDGATWTPDITTKLQITPSWSVTDHPVEEGVTVSDHVQLLPQTIVASVVLTENPPAPLQGGRTHLRDRLAWLRATANEGAPVDIVTRRLGTFQSYVITGLPHSVDNVSRLAFDITLREVRIATATMVFIAVPDVVDDGIDDVATGAPDEIDTGEQATTSTEDDPAEAAAEEVDQSVLASLIDWW